MTTPSHTSIDRHGTVGYGGAGPVQGGPLRNGPHRSGEGELPPPVPARERARHDGGAQQRQAGGRQGEVHQGAFLLEFHMYGGVGVTDV